MKSLIFQKKFCNMKSLYFKILSKTQCGYINPQKDTIHMIGVKTDNVKILVGRKAR